MLNYHFQATDFPEYLHVVVGGEHDSASITYDYMLRMMKSARENHKQIIYLEEDFPDHPGILEVYQSFSQLISHLEEFTVVFYDHKSSQFERNKLLESAANDLGANFHVCKTRKEAKRLLASLLVDKRG